MPAGQRLAGLAEEIERGGAVESKFSGAHSLATVVVDQPRSSRNKSGASEFRRVPRDVRRLRAGMLPRLAVSRDQRENSRSR